MATSGKGPGIEGPEEQGAENAWSSEEAALIGNALAEVMNETRALFHRLRAVGDQVHRPLGISTAERSVMAGLARLGPQTVPEMARLRPVSRQHIQGLVNLLLDKGFVELSENPAHKRSHLVQLTPKGEAAMKEIDRTEKRLLEELVPRFAAEDLRATAEVLRALRTSFESGPWGGGVEEETSPGGARELP